jgi:basic membrane protein A and related proteins
LLSLFVKISLQLSRKMLIISQLFFWKRKTWLSAIVQHRRSRIVLFLVTLLISVSCQVSSRNTTTTSQRTTQNGFKVAVVLPQNVDDNSWNEAGYQALQVVKEKIGAITTYQDNVDVPSGQPSQVFEKVFREYAHNGYDFIIGHGGQFVSAIEKVAKEFPRTKFAVVGGYGGNNNNVGGITYQVTEAGYWVGSVAGLATKNNKIGYIGGQVLADGLELSKFYEKGAHAINSQVEVSVKWTDSFTDLEKVTKITQSLIKSGIDVIMVGASQLAPTVIKLAEEAKINAIAPFTDLYPLAPQTVITSLLIEYPAIYLQATTLVREGRWEGKLYRFNLKQGAFRLAPFREHLTPEQLTKLNEVKQSILLGKLNLS